MSGESTSATRVEQTAARRVLGTGNKPLSFWTQIPYPWWSVLASGLRRHGVEQTYRTTRVFDDELLLLYALLLYVDQ